jgi:hypothetical protein
MKIPARWSWLVACLAFLGFDASAAESGVTIEGLASEVADEAAVQRRMDRGRALAQSGDHAGALNDFLWCFDVGMPRHSRFAGVRTSFLLSDIAKLTTAYPHAREALVERCDAAEQRLKADAQDRSAVADFAALCATLGDEARLLRVFEALPTHDPRRVAFGLRAFRILLPKQRYADALSAMPAERILALWDASVKRSPPSPSAMATEARLRSSIASGLDYIEALAGAGDLKHAREMVDLLVELDASPDTQRQLAVRLARAGQPDLLRDTTTGK